jgi:hypothetical protein
MLVSVVHRVRTASWLPLLPLLLGLSVVLLVLLPNSATTAVIPICGAIALALEALCLLRLAGQLRRTLFRQARATSGIDPAQLHRLRRRLLPLLNGLAGTAILAIGFVPMAMPILTQASGSNAARLLWLLTGGGLFIAIALSELVALVLTELQQPPAAPDAPPSDDAEDVGARSATV